MAQRRLGEIPVVRHRPVEPLEGWDVIHRDEGSAAFGTSHQHTARTQQGQLAAQKALGVGDVFEDEEMHDGVEAAVGRRRRTQGVDRILAGDAARPQVVAKNARGLDADTVVAGFHQRIQHETGGTADLEHTAAGRQHFLQ
ncbi:MAG: hypothetical protein IPG33_16800 [Betaproteobacteria bacterium]|nr:hypothetical protein [Betaproteobacteria bacterium]